MNGDGGGSDALREDVYIVRKVLRPARSLTVLGRTDLVEVPHDKFTIPCTREDLLIVTWMSLKFFSPSLRQRLTPAAPSNVSADTLHFEPASGPQIARRIDAMTTSANGRLVVWIE